jgi:methionine-S-sulfoxide reductase
MRIIIIAAALILIVSVIVVYVQEELPVEEKNTAHEGKIPPIDRATPAETETATFSLGCFWGAEARFGWIPGVVRTRVGYAGGGTENPTYHNIGDHIETVKIEYDPRVVSYEELIEIFWRGHDPSMPPWKRQYASAVFYHDDDQKAVALATRDREKEKYGSTYTEIISFSAFYLAEEHHQKYHLQQSLFMAEFEHTYSSFEEFINSTAVARVNGYVSGYGTAADLRKEIDTYGLSSEGKKTLLELVEALDNRGG